MPLIYDNLIYKALVTVQCLPPGEQLAARRIPLQRSRSSVALYGPNFTGTEGLRHGTDLGLHACMWA